MTIEEKMIEFDAAIAPDVAEANVAESELKAAETMILNKLYPFGYPDETEIPARYERLQIKLAVELYNQRGAEGQTSHGENGTTRTWGASRILAQIVPNVGSVITNA
jgi:hypothetical protein